MELRSALPSALILGLLLGLALAAARGAPSGAGALDAAGSAEPPVAFDLPVVWNESVARFVTLFEKEQPDRMALYLKRAGRYEGMIRSKLRARGMPEDLLYLSMIESGFNTNARSAAQAVGLWQFIAETGRRYGLRVDAYVDERRDPEKSTDAALSYLQDLHGQFGSWNLAAAAYNTGENRVARIMREETGSHRGRESDFWRIRDRLPGETREYVPLIYAAAVIGKQPQKYGLEGVQRWLPVDTDTVLVPGGVALGVVARAVEVEAGDLERLNPHLLQGITPPGDEPYPVRLPDGRAALYFARFEQVRAEVDALAQARLEEERRVEAERASAARSAARRHTVRRGETLSVIAKRHGVSVAALQRANSLGRRTLIRAGQVLAIPAA